MHYLVASIEGQLIPGYDERSLRLPAHARVEARLDRIAGLTLGIVADNNKQTPTRYKVYHRRILVKIKNVGWEIEGFRRNSDLQTVCNIDLYMNGNVLLWLSARGAHGLCSIATRGVVLPVR